MDSRSPPAPATAAEKVDEPGVPCATFLLSANWPAGSDAEAASALPPVLPPPALADGGAAAALTHAVCSGTPTRLVRCYATPLDAPAADVAAVIARSVTAAAGGAATAVLSAAGFAARYASAVRGLKAGTVTQLSATMFN